MIPAGEIVWVEVAPSFGSAMPNGSCNALVGSQVCGFPRRADGSCTNGHPAQPADAQLVDIDTERASAFGIAPQTRRRQAVRATTTQENR